MPSWPSWTWNLSSGRDYHGNQWWLDCHTTMIHDLLQIFAEEHKTSTSVAPENNLESTYNQSSTVLSWLLHAVCRCYWHQEATSCTKWCDLIHNIMLNLLSEACKFLSVYDCIYFSNTMRFVLILQRNMDCTERKEDFVVYCHRRAKDYACIARRIGKKLQV